MPFTIKEIEDFLEKDEHALFKQFSKVVKQSASYQVIQGYLTGKAQSLIGLQHDDMLIIWSSLSLLLENIEDPSPNDQLVLDVIMHPEMENYGRNDLQVMLLDYALAHPSEQAFSAVLSHFRTMGASDTDIFSFVIFRLGYSRSEKQLAPSPLKDFLTGHIRASRALIYPYHGYLAFTHDWSILYFKLLEEARPDLTTEYVEYGTYVDTVHNSPVRFLTTYKDGYYLPSLLTFIRDMTNGKPELAPLKFRAAMLLWETDEEQFSDLVNDVSRQYLDCLKAGKIKQNWNDWHRLTTSAGIDIGSLEYSTCAIYFLLLAHPGEALEQAADMFRRKVFVPVRMLDLFCQQAKKAVFPLFEMALQADSAIGGIRYHQDVAQLLQKHFTPASYLPVIWRLTGSKSKLLREMVARIIAEKDSEAVTRAINLLNSKIADARQTASLILSYFHAPDAIAAIQKVLNRETNDDARDVLLQIVADTLPKTADHHLVSKMVQAAKQRGKLNKPVEKWLDEAHLPPMYYTDGLPAEPDTVRFLLYRMSRIKEMHADLEARHVIQLLDKEKSAPFAAALMKLFRDKEGKPDHKYLMALAALLGDDGVVDKIRTTTNNWIEEGRYKMAEHGVGALALQGSNKSLCWVEWYSRKYKSKKANVGAAALAALETAAEQLGITTFELGDRIVPDLGFEGLFKHFTAGGEEYRAFIDGNFKIAFFNEDNKKIKSVPAAADVSLKEEFKAIAKEVRDITKSQSSRMEYYLVTQRRWSFEQWQAFFLQNPVMFIYATKLLWGVYDAAGHLTETFLCSEDTSLQNVTGDEISLNDRDIIAIVHPSQLDAQLLQQWKQQFFDLSIEPVFPQLERRIPEMKGIDLSKAIIMKFDGRQTKPESIRSTLERSGWHKGPVGDGGMIESFNLLYAEKKLEAVLEVDGVGAGYGWGMDEKLGRLYVVDKNMHTERRGVYPKDDNDERLVKIKDLPAIFLHEMLAAVETIQEAASDY